MTLDDTTFQEIKRILMQLIPELEVRAFGSRVGAHPKPSSDLDLVIMNQKPLARIRRAELREAFEESLIPFRIDFIEWARISDSFRAIIKPQSKVILMPEAGSLS